MSNMMFNNPIQMELDTQIQYIISQHISRQSISQQEGQIIYATYTQRDVQNALAAIQQRCGNGPADARVINEIANEYVQNMVISLRAQAQQMQMGNRFAPAGNMGGFLPVMQPQQQQGFGLFAGVGGPIQQQPFTYGGNNPGFAAPPQQQTGFQPVVQTLQPQPQRPVSPLQNIAPEKGQPDMVVEDSKFEEPIPETVDTRHTLEVPELIRHSVHRTPKGGQCTDVSEIKLSAGYVSDEDAIRDARALLNRHTTIHASYVCRIRYNKLWLIRESPVKINAVFRKLITAVSQSPDYVTIINNIIAVLQDAPSSISRMFEGWLVARLNYYFNQGCFQVEGVNVMVNLSELKDVFSITDKTTEYADIKKLMEKEGDRYLDFVKQRITDLSNMIKSTSICDVARSADITDILHGYGDETIDNVNARDILRSLVDINAAPGENVAEIRKNSTTFMSRYTVMRVPTVVWATNIVPAEQLANLGITSTGVFRNDRNLIVLKRPTNMLEWVLLENCDAAPLVISINNTTSTKLNVVFNINKALVFSTPK